MMTASARKGTIVCLCFALANISSMDFSAGASVKKSSEERQIRRIESKLSEEASKLNAFQSKEARLLTLLADLEKQVADTKKETEALGQNVRDVRQKLDVQKKNLKKLKSNLMNTELQIGEYLTALYKFSRRKNLRILANAEMLSGLQRNIKYIGIVTEKDRMQLRTLTQKASGLHDEITKKEASMGVTERMLTEKTSRMALLETSIEENVLLLMRIHEEKEFYETSVEELETAVADLKLALNPMTSQNNFAIDPSLNFEDCKGRLPLPIEGKIVHRSEKRGNAFPGAKGVLIQADSDKEVRAVFRGEVAYSGPLKGYGEVVILNHGGRFFTVSAHLSKREKEKGEQVQGGDIVGLVGENGSDKGATLYFEVRKADEKLNSAAWLKRD
jgi:septal ring factor EnvC (AmiA/AmiB activator)